MKAKTLSALSDLARKTNRGRDSLTGLLPAVCLLLLALAPAARPSASRCERSLIASAP